MVFWQMVAGCFLGSLFGTIAAFWIHRLLTKSSKFIYSKTAKHFNESKDGEVRDTGEYIRYG